MSVTMSTSGILNKHQYIQGLECDVTIAPHSLVPTILHEFYYSKGHQGTIHTFEALRRSYWWPKVCKDIVNYIVKCSVCTRYLPNMVRHPQQHLEAPHVPMAVLAVDTIVVYQ